MAPRFAAVMVLFPLACSGVAAEDAPKRVVGRVVDEAGRPILGASVSALWGANGLTWNQVAAVRGTEPEKVWHWVVLYFWSPRCSPCLGKELPELMAFYEAHKAQRDRFEVLAFCCDFEERLKDIAGLEKELEPVKKAVWGGKVLPFPVLLDNTFQTYERFGLEGSGVSNLLLIDPEGKLVEGDLKTLAGNLDRLGQNSR